jgi:hypothetical protein
MTLVAGIGAGASDVASAHVDVGVDIGVPGVAIAPEPVHDAPPPVYAGPPPAPVVVISSAGMATDTTKGTVIGNVDNVSSHVTTEDE